jgi:hypothetical protein
MVDADVPLVFTTPERGPGIVEAADAVPTEPMMLLATAVTTMAVRTMRAIRLTFKDLFMTILLKIGLRRYTIAVP